jgi:hypothetical protein
MNEYKDSKTALVADVDCTAGGQSLCEKHKVDGYPSIKYGDPDELKDYSGGRDLASLQKFAAENLGPTCDPDNLDLCDETDKKFITKFKKWDVDELDLAIEEKTEKLNKIEAATKKITERLEGQVRDLKEKIEKETKKKDNAIDKEKKNIGYKYMQAVKASRTPKADPDEDDDDDLTMKVQKVVQDPDLDEGAESGAKGEEL